MTRGFVNALGTITFISKRVEDVLGYLPQDLVGHPVTALLGKEGSMVALEHLVAARWSVPLRRVSISSFS